MCWTSEKGRKFLRGSECSSKHSPSLKQTIEEHIRKNTNTTGFAAPECCKWSSTTTSGLHTRYGPSGPCGGVSYQQHGNIETNFSAKPYFRASEHTGAHRGHGGAAGDPTSAHLPGSPHLNRPHVSGKAHLSLALRSFARVLAHELASRALFPLFA